MSNVRAHGLYDSQGHRIKGWQGKIKMDMNSGLPRLEPPIRIAPGETVYAWFEGKLVAILTNEYRGMLSG